MKIKICGMKYGDNIVKVAELKPDYMGFIFYPGSSRCISESIPDLPESIAKVGVFVNEEINQVVKIVSERNLQAVQLHGDESAEYCRDLRSTLLMENDLDTVIIIKAFAISASFPFETLDAYRNHCDYFLFDAKGVLPGGNGILFDWNLLLYYKLDVPFFLSGGIGLDALPEIEKFRESSVAQYCHAIDVNSRFEDQPGFKNIDKLSEFINEL